jgi:hypothetical protein
MSRLKDDYHGYQEVFEGDVFLLNHDAVFQTNQSLLPYSDLESCSYTAPYINEEEFHTKLKDTKSLEIKSIITNWGTHILGKANFDNIADSAVDSIIKPTKSKAKKTK